MSGDGDASAFGAPGVRRGVLLLADSQEWESTALSLLRASRSFVVARRCLDVPDLMALAVTGEASLAVVAGDASGFDAACVAHLPTHGVAAVAVVPDGAVPGAWTAPRGTAGTVGVDLAGLDGALAAALETREPREAPQRTATAAPEADLEGRADEAMSGRAGEQADISGGTAAPSPTQPTASSSSSPRGRRGRVVCVWGPVGSPGRTTIALALAGELAARGRRTTLLDLDPWGGTVGQHLGILSEVSGLLAASRAASGDTLTADRLDELCVGVGRHLRVLTGLPGADRWSEVGVGTVEHLLGAARELGDVVVDPGPALDPAAVGGWGGRPVREHLATEAVAAADVQVLVGSADPVGLTRLVRAAAQLAEIRPEGPDLVLLNRQRPTLGWGPEEVVDVVRRAVPDAPVVTLPDDRAGVDRALAEGALLTESGPGPLRAHVRDLVEDRLLALLGETAPTSGPDDRGEQSVAGQVAQVAARLIPRRGARDRPR
ncbi:hypothetical protein KLP28_10630 [Nocardioidaceae bacterium]|nr:hypothetical protein KLP28_10630 [Nocardioidaceae bacterium]